MDSEKSGEAWQNFLGFVDSAKSKYFISNHVLKTADFSIWFQNQWGSTGCPRGLDEYVSKVLSPLPLSPLFSLNRRVTDNAYNARKNFEEATAPTMEKMKDGFSAATGTWTWISSPPPTFQREQLKLLNQWSKARPVLLKVWRKLLLLRSKARATLFLGITFFILLIFLITALHHPFLNTLSQRRALYRSILKLRKILFPLLFGRWKRLWHSMYSSSKPSSLIFRESIKVLKWLRAHFKKDLKVLSSNIPLISLISHAERDWAGCAPAHRKSSYRGLNHGSQCFLKN